MQSQKLSPSLDIIALVIIQQLIGYVIQYDSSNIQQNKGLKYDAL